MFGNCTPSVSPCQHGPDTGFTRTASAAAGSGASPGLGRRWVWGTAQAIGVRTPPQRPARRAAWSGTAGNMVILINETPEYFGVTEKLGTRGFDRGGL